MSRLTAYSSDMYPNLHETWLQHCVVVTKASIALLCCPDPVPRRKPLCARPKIQCRTSRVFLGSRPPPIRRCATTIPRVSSCLERSKGLLPRSKDSKSMRDAFVWRLSLPRLRHRRVGASAFLRLGLTDDVIEAVNSTIRNA